MCQILVVDKAIYDDKQFYYGKWISALRGVEFIKKEIESILNNDIAVNDKPKDYLIIDYQGFPDLVELELYDIKEFVTLAEMILAYGLGIDWLIKNYSDRYSLAELQNNLNENYIGVFFNYSEYGKLIFENESNLSIFLIMTPKRTMDF